jgi:calreticulin
MNLASLAAVLGFAASLVSGKVYFEDTFTGVKEATGLQSQWQLPEEQFLAIGELETSSGTFYADAEESRGMRTTQDSQFYTAFAPFKEPLDTCNKDLVLQFSVKNEHELKCGGTYFKLSSGDTNLKAYSGDTAFKVLFGPDVCGPTRRVFLMLERDGRVLTMNRQIEYPNDRFTHFYTLVVNHPSMKYRVMIDGKVVGGGEIVDDFSKWSDEPRLIPDPESKKPEDWDDRVMVDDPEDSKPEDYDLDVPPMIADPDAQEPEDWDETEENPWRAPEIPNPEWVEWTPRQIPNPKYKGLWRPKLVANPAFKPETVATCYKDLTHIVLDVWQVQAGSIFDNILVTDSVEEAVEHRKKHTEGFVDAEKEAFNVLVQQKIAKQIAELTAAQADEAGEAEDAEQVTGSSSNAEEANEHIEL